MPIKGVWKVPRTLADGRKRWYYYTSRQGGVCFWHSDDKPLDETRLSTEFVRAYEEACQVERGHLPGSFERAFHEYQKKCKRFAKLKLKSQNARLRYLEAWLDMPLKGGLLARKAPLTVFDQKRIVPYIIDHRDKVWGHSPSAAHEATIALSAFLRWCVGTGKLDTIKTSEIEAVYERPIDRARIWEPNERILFLQDAPWHLKFFFELEEFVGLRLEDAVRLPRTAIKREHIVIPTGKSGGQNYAIVPIIPPLRSLLERIDEKLEELKEQQNAKGKTFPVPMTVLFNSRGHPWTPDGLSTSFYRHRDKVLSGDAKPSIHDLRKTAATNMVIQQHRYPDQITDKVLADAFAWMADSLPTMKRIYVSDAAVIEALTKRN